MGTKFQTRTALLVFGFCAVWHRAAPDRGVPVVRIDSGLVSGRRIVYNNRSLDVFYGIRYGMAPVREQRFERPLPPRPWRGMYKAWRKSKPCRQVPLSVNGNITLTYKDTSEDCLFLNVIKSTCSSSNSCSRLRPVVFYIHGGAFQWGDSSLPIYDGRNFVATTDFILVTFNYRVGVFGFLSTGTSDVPGNMGLWDQNLALRWVRNNIARFGGDPDDVTLWGQSAGGISAGIHALSPYSRGLFKRMILQSGTPLSGIMAASYRGIGRLLEFSGSLNCYNSDRDWTDQIADMLDCIRTKRGSEIIRAITDLPYTKQVFAPVSGDDFLPSEPLEMDPLVIETHEIFAGSTLQEGALFVDNMRYVSPGLFEELHGDYRTGVTLALSVLTGASVSESKEIVHAYYGGYEVEHDFTSVLEILAKIIGDAVFHCPTHYYLTVAAEKGISAYRYVFAHRPSYSLWPEWMGTTHTDDIMFTLGTIRDASEAATEGISPFAVALNELGAKNITATVEEEEFMRDLMDTFASFVDTGIPTIPHSNEQWPLYNGSNPEAVFFRPQNYTKDPLPEAGRCILWKKLLLKQDINEGPQKPYSPPTRKPVPAKKPSRKPQGAMDNTIPSGSPSSTASLALLTSIAVVVHHALRC
ncbi:cholinesterase 1-like [Ornithodoros turicata]|uniref:cholinesterase 1-like n=1 Tax=Ornithodoros turicata TaxID=34597 RepID=UPI003139A677